MNLFKRSVMATLMAANFFLSNVAFADSQSDGALGCAACGSGMLMFMIAPLVIQVLLLVWVVKDSRERGIESPLGWMAFVFLVPLVGILVYWFSRPPLKSKSE